MSELPTEPYTVIHVTWKHASPAHYSAGVLVLKPNKGWEFEPDVIWEPELLASEIDSFDVLAEPRSVTAKAVLNRLAEETDFGELPGISIVKIRREFKVTDE